MVLTIQGNLSVNKEFLKPVLGSAIKFLVCEIRISILTVLLTIVKSFCCPIFNPVLFFLKPRTAPLFI